jgi:pyrimidine operon attenuation protein/uracil phosphoribosyltransferase
VTGAPPPVGELDVTMHRDDLAESAGRKPLRETRLPFDITGRAVVLVDDVLYSGRTIRAALDALTAFGRPSCIRLAVLVDRGHRELPIRADVVGREVATEPSATVRVRLREADGSDEIVLEPVS